MASTSRSISDATPGADTPLPPSADQPLLRVVALVKKLFDVPVVLVSRVVDDHLHFLATSGFSVRDADIDYLPCSRVVESAKPMVVEDVSEVPDWTERYAKGIGFYASVPILEAEGKAIGALSLIDVRERHVEETAVGVLEECAALIAELIRIEPAPVVERTPQASMLIDLFHDAPSAVFVTDVAHRILAVNEAAARLLSCPEAELIGSTFTAAMPDDARIGEEQLLADMLAGKRDHYQTDSRLVDRAGAERRVHMSVSLVRDDEEKPAYALRILEETSRRDQALEELRLRDRAIAGMPLGLAVVDMSTPSAPFIFCNQAFEHLTGYRQQDILGSNTHILRGAGTERDALEMIDGYVAREEEGRVDLTCYRADGRPFDASVTLIPVWGEEDALTHYVWLMQDRTEVNHLREQYASLRTELLRSTVHLQKAAQLIAEAYGLQPIEEEAQALLKTLYEEVQYLEAKVTLFDEHTGDGLPVVANVAGNPIAIDQVDPDFGHSLRDVCRIRMQMEQTGEQGTWCLDVPIITGEGMRGLLTLYAHPGRLFDESAATAARRVAGRLAMSLTPAAPKKPEAPPQAAERVALLPES